MMLSVENPTELRVRLVVRRSIVAVRVAGLGTLMGLCGFSLVDTLADHSSPFLARFMIRRSGQL
jgi:hypothetical protein